MKSKRIQLLAPGTLSVLLLVSACSGGGTPSATSPAASGSAAVSSKPSSSATPAERPKISVLSYNLAGNTPNVSNWNENIYVKKLEELTGTDLEFEFLNAADYSTQLTLRFASNELKDLIATTGIDSPAHPNAVKQGAFLQLNDLIDKYGPNLKAKIPEKVWKSPQVSVDGKIYAIPLLSPHSELGALYIRQDWLKKLNMPMPKTLDDWLAYFEKVKVEDMDGDGDPNNEYGFEVRENFSSSAEFFYQFGVALDYWVMQDGQFVPSVITPKMKDALAFWRMMYKNGYIPPNSFTNKLADWQAAIYKDKAGSWLHFVDNAATWWAPSNFSNPNADPVIVEPPLGPGGQGTYPETTGLYRVWVIPSKEKNPERLIKFLDFVWGSPEVQKFFTFGIEGYNYDMVDGKVKWDITSPNNAKNEENLLYMYNMNFSGVSRNNDEQIKLNPFAPKLIKGYEIAEKYKIKSEAMYMPVMEAFKTRPELLPNFGSGNTLLMEMFAKVITSNVDIDAEFDKFVKEWKSRGGDEAIKQATAWHKQFYGN
ncbi:type 2 periplasmic-binding domain-containing protein [Paenibacillus cymbidii]|uniref:extracellular solute-binding protein n=1 Tax=Paenibacillus cymbidii TaxID=1639034 RepID=UPI0010820660|nr:extracellular solute-binding protein [Paenibacillus cymbidii]